MKFKQYLQESDYTGSPDKWYMNPGSVTWVYLSPDLYWYDSKRKSFMKNGKTVKIDPKKWFDPRSYSGPHDWNYYAEKGNLKHSDLGDAFGIRLHALKTTLSIRGRTSPDRRKVKTWHDYDFKMGLLKKKEEHIYNKSMEAVYKYIMEECILEEKKKKKKISTGLKRWGHRSHVSGTKRFMKTLGRELEKREDFENWIKKHQEDRDT